MLFVNLSCNRSNETSAEFPHDQSSKEYKITIKGNIINEVLFTPILRRYFKSHIDK